MSAASTSASTPASDPPVVGVAGLGAMGSPMSRQLLEAGLRVIGYDPDETALERHVDRGGIAAHQVGDLGAADVVITSLPSTSVVLQVLGELGRAAATRKRRLVVVETSTLSLEDKTTALAATAAWPLALVDCPVSGTSAQAEVGDLVGYYSGLQDADADAFRTVISAITREAYDVGPFGNGTRMKLVANLLVAVHNVAAAEALLLAERSGLDLDLVLRAVGDGAGSSRMLQVRGPLMVTRTFEPATARVAIFEKDLAAIHALADDVGSPTPLLDASGELYARAMSQGRGNHDAASVFGVLEGSARSGV